MYSILRVRRARAGVTCRRHHCVRRGSLIKIIRSDCRKDSDRRFFVHVPPAPYGRAGFADARRRRRKSVRRGENEMRLADKDSYLNRV